MTLMSRLLGAAALVSIALPASSALASDSASMNITVIIPPIAATRAATAEGAVGAWTVTGEAGGLMLAVRDGQEDAGELVVYRSDRNLLSTSFADAAMAEAMGLSLDASAPVQLNGLERTSYSITADPSAEVTRPVVLVLSSI